MRRDPAESAVLVKPDLSAPEIRVLGTITTYPPSTGGAQLHQHTLFQYMRPTVDVRIASFWNHNRTDWLIGTTLRAHSAPHSYEVDGVKVHRLGFGAVQKLSIAPLLPFYYPAMGRVIPPLARMIEHKLEEISFDSDLVHNMRIGREPISFASLNLARRRGLPFVLTPFHHPRWVGWRYREYLKLYREADLVVALTKSEEDLLLSVGVRKERIVVTGVGPLLAPEGRPEDFRSKHSIDGPMVLFLGQHFDYKGFPKLLRAAPRVWARYPDTHFVFIGPPVGGSEEHFKNADRRILRLGKVELQEKSNALAAATLLCVPSSQESFGAVYVESWSYGRPVIGCRIPAVSEVITDGVDGLLVDQDVDQIAEAILELLADPQRSDAMGEAGSLKVQRKYGWEALARTTIQAYRDVIRAGSA